MSFFLPEFCAHIPKINVRRNLENISSQVRAYLFPGERYVRVTRTAGPAGFPYPAYLLTVHHGSDKKYKRLPADENSKQCVETPSFPWHCVAAAPSKHIRYMNLTQKVILCIPVSWSRLIWLLAYDHFGPTECLLQRVPSNYPFEKMSKALMLRTLKNARPF